MAHKTHERSTSGRGGGPIGQSSQTSALLGDAATAVTTGGSHDDVPNIVVTSRRGVAVGISLGILILLQATNMSGMAMIQGQVANDLHAHAEAASWFTASYLISLSSFASVAGRLATVFSPRSFVLPIGVLFAVGSLVTARAASVAVLLCGRALAGTGGAGVLGLGIIFVLELVNKRRRGLFVALVNTGFTAGVAFGALVYGALVPILGWRHIFLWQIPISLIGGLSLFISLPNSMKPGGGAFYIPGTLRQKLARIDYLGAFLLARKSFTIVLFLYGLAADVHVLSLGLSLGCLLAFLATEYLIASDPIIPLAVLSSRGVILTCLAQLGLITARWSMLYYAPIFLLAVRGATPASAGSILIPTNVGFCVGGFLVGAFHIRRAGSFWLPTIVVGAIFSLSLFLLGLVAVPNSSMVAFVATVLLNGFATGAALNYALAHILHIAHRDTEYVSTSLLGTFRGFGSSFGTSIGGGIFYRFLKRSLKAGFSALDGRGRGEKLSPRHTRLIERLLSTPGLVFSDSLNAEEKQIAIKSYSGAIRGVWYGAALLSVIAIGVQAAAGWTAPDHHSQVRYAEEEDQVHAALLGNECIEES